jgi:nucleoside-diphosphate-sugar epimerase
MIAVTGATGTTGSQVVAELLRRGADVRALTRDPEKAKTILGSEVQIAAADFERRETSSRARTPPCLGCTAAVANACFRTHIRIESRYRHGWKPRIEPLITGGTSVPDVRAGSLRCGSFASA